MNVTQKKFRLSAVAFAMMSVFGSAIADDEEIAELIKPESSISIGAGAWSSDRRQQGIYDGMRDSGVYGLIDADIIKRDDATGTWMKLKATNLGIDNREIRGEYLRQGDFGVSLDYNRLTRENPNTYTTRLQGIGTTSQVGSTTLTPSLQSVSLSTVREGVGLGLYKNLAPGLDLNFSFKTEEKSGTRAWGRGSAAQFAVEPIGSTTNQVEGTLSYTSKTFQLSGGYYGSWYDNRNTMVSFYTTTVGNAPTYLSLPLDNQAHQIFLNGGYTFTPTTRATFKVSYTRATQDDHLPTKDVPGLSLASSPSSLNGQVNTTLVQLGVTSRPIKDLSLVANLRYHDFDDATPVNRYVQQVVGGVLQPCGSGAAQCVDNTPMSYRTLSGKLEGTYRLGDGYSVIAGVEERHQDRSLPAATSVTGGVDNQRVVPMRSKLDETTWRLELRRSLSDAVNGSLAYLNSRRTGSTYTPAGAGAGGAASDYINPINIADRDRNKLRLAIDWTPVESLSFQFSLEGGRDRYDHDAARPYGLIDGSNQLATLDAAYTLSDKWKVNAWYSYDRTHASQLNSRTLATRSTKDNDLSDTGNSVGLGLRGEVTSRFKLGTDLLWARNVSRYEQSLNALQASGMEGNLPAIENKLTRLSVFSIYSLDKSSDLRLDLISEHWKTNDWSWMFANGTPFTYGTGNTDSTVVTSNPRQSSTFIGMRYIYKFQ